VITQHFSSSQVVTLVPCGSHFSIAMGLRLKTKSYGKEGNRHLVISKKRDVWQMLEQLLRNGGSTERYDLVMPTGSAPQQHAW
jgi:hypothetical protein